MTDTAHTTFYGPHACADCGQMIAKAAYEQGGKAFDYPAGPIYPNTPWHPHACPGGAPRPTLDYVPTSDTTLSDIASTLTFDTPSYDPPTIPDSTPDSSSFDFGGGGGFDGGGGGDSF